MAEATTPAEPFDAVLAEPPKIIGVNGRSKRLPAHKDRKKRALQPGRRKVTLWDVEGDDSFIVEFATGKAKHHLRLSREALAALVDLYRAKDPTHLTWRVLVDLSEALKDGATPHSNPPPSGEG